MKKWTIGVVVVLVAAVAFAVTAGEKVKVKVKEKGDQTKMVVKEKGEGMTEKTVVKAKGDTFKGKEVTKFHPGVLTENGYLIKDVVKFKKMDKKGDYVYVTKDKKTYRMKFRDSAKENMLKSKKGDTITIYSTHPLTAKEWATYNTLHYLEKQ